MQKKIILYQDHIADVGGVETNLYNMCVQLKDYYDILVLYGKSNWNQLSRIIPLVNCEKYDKEKEYDCDICIRNSLYWHIPENIKAEKYYEILHADYEWLKSTGTRIKEWDKAEKIGCGEYVSNQYAKLNGFKPPFIRNILAPKQDINKVYKFISCTRLEGEKGYKRILKMVEMLRKANIKFTWDIFTNSKIDKLPEEFHLWSPRFDTFDYVANADYTVLLSDTEGLPYTIQESLQYGTPCIVTDIGGNTELIKNGINGYVVPLDMNFDINIIKNIPQFEEYKGTPVEEWCAFLGGAEYVKRRRKAMMKIRALRSYTDTLLNRLVNKGEEYEVEPERANTIVNMGFAEVVEVVSDEEPVVAKAVVKEPVKRNTRAKSR